MGDTVMAVAGAVHHRIKHVADVAVSNVDKKAVDGQIPVRLCNYLDVYNHDHITAELPLMDATASIEQIERFTLRSGDVLITKDSETPDDIGVAALVRDDLSGVVCGYHLAVLRPRRSSVQGPFLHWAMSSTLARSQLSARATGITRFGLRQSAIREVIIPVPTPARQRAVADYLDRETARIDALIEKKQRLLALLDEREFSSLSRTLIPRAAEFAHLRRFATIQGGLTVDAGRDVGPDCVTRPYLRVANVQDGRLDLEAVVEVTLPAALAARCTLRSGDVLMTEGGDIDKLGRGTVWRGELPECLHQNHVFAVRANEKRLDPDYLALLTRTSHARCHFEMTGVRSTNLASTSSSKIMDLRVPVLDVTEQRALVAQWRAQHRGIEETRKALDKQVGLLQERRRALITAAVTGQLDIPEAA